MTKQLEELFNLLPSETTDDIESTVLDSDTAAAEVTAIHLLEAQSEEIDKIEAALPMVKGLEASDQEMDELADIAKKTFENLVDLGMNVDIRSAGRIFEVAGTMLGHAITAKTAKLDKKLKMISLQLKKQQLDNQADTNPTAIPGTGVSMTRNALLDRILNKKSIDDNSNKH